MKTKDKRKVYYAIMNRRGKVWSIGTSKGDAHRLAEASDLVIPVYLTPIKQP